MTSISYLIGNLDKERGGAQQLLYDICTHLPQNEFNLTVYHMFGPGTFAPDFREQDVSVTHLEATSNYDIRAYWRLISRLREESPDILHTNSPISGVWGRTAGKIANVPHLVSVEHSLHTSYPIKNQLANGLTLPFTDVVVGVSRVVSNSFSRWETILLPASIRNISIHNGVDIQSIQNSSTKDDFPIGDQCGFSKDDIVVGSVGRLNKAKGYKHLIKSFNNIKYRFPNTKLVIIGGGPKREELESRASETGHSEDICFTGYVPDVYPFIPNFDVAVFPSLWEGFGLTPVEAMVAKRPVVATNIKTFEEVIGDAGVLVEPRNPSALATAISSLLDNPERRNELGTKGYERAVSNFSIERTVEEYADLYRSLVDE